MAERLLGKIAIVTGANSGMGMATAHALLDEGTTVSDSWMERLTPDLEQELFGDREYLENILSLRVIRA